MRIFNILFMLITVLYSFKIAEKFFKQKNISYIVAVLISFLPRFSFTSAGINNDAFVIAISTVFIYYLFKLLDKKLNLKSSILLGLILGIGFLSKPQFYIFLFILLIFYLYKIIKYKKIKRMIISFFTVLLIAVIVSSGWFWFALVNQNKLPTSQVIDVLNINNNKSHLAFVGILIYVFLRYIFLINSYFGMLGCCHEIFLPSVAEIFFLASVAIGIFGYLIFLFNQKEGAISEKIFILLIPLLLELGYLVVYLRQPLKTGTVDFPIDGRYLYPVISCLTIIFVAGLLQIVSKKLHKPILIIVTLATIYINFYTLIFMIIPRYYL